MKFVEQALYYCKTCGIVRMLSVADEPETEDCLVCHTVSAYERIIPVVEDDDQEIDIPPSGMDDYGSIDS